MTSNDPPPYDGATLHGFPAGYFLIENCGTKSLLDVARNSSQDGTEVVVWKDKDTSRSKRSASADNQVFFVDYHGALCSKASGHAIGIEGGIPVLRHRKPFGFIPGVKSPHLPRITYDTSSELIRVTFDSDPNYPPPDSSALAESGPKGGFVLSAVPVCKRPSFVHSAREVVSVITTSFARPQILLSSPSTPVHPNESRTTLDSTHSREGTETERSGAVNDADDSPELGRPVCMVELADGWRDQKGVELSANARLRLRWKIIQLEHEETSQQES